MSILIDEKTPILVQGITGDKGSFHAKEMLDYGSNVVAGVTPGKGGKTVHGVPVFNTVKEAVKETSAARKEYERAIELFHKRHFDEAARRFEDLIEKHPDEKEFLDRARMYLGACRTGKKTKGLTAAEPEELYHAAVFEKNRGNVEKALELLRRNPGRRDGDGRVHYLTACCLALQGDVEQALLSLRKAIAADDQNRIQARLEADLAILRGTQGFTELVAGGA